MKISNIDRNTCKRIHADIDMIMKKVAEKYGLTFVPATARYSESTFKMKIEFQTTDRVGLAKELDFAGEWALNLNESHHGVTFHTDQGSYKYVGFKARRHKFPILGERADGKRFKFSPLVAQRIIVAAEKKAA